MPALEARRVKFSLADQVVRMVQAVKTVFGPEIMLLSASRMLLSIRNVGVGDPVMCHIFAAQSTNTYASQTRSVRLGGHVTSIRLEKVFWDILEEIADAQDLPFGKFLTKLHDEVLELSGTSGNFASLLRCACLTYVGEVKGRSEIENALRREAGMSDERIAVPAE